MKVFPELVKEKYKNIAGWNVSKEKKFINFKVQKRALLFI